MKTKGKGRGTKKARAERQKQSFKRAYLTKAQAARRLQVTNAEFERLAIIKGIYPREPKRFDGSSGKDKSYYFAKDILWLEREPMLQKMREFSSFKKKLTRLKGRREDYDAKLFEKTHKPQHSLSTILKERYPTFADALRDLDDALTHIFLYAALPPLVHSSSTIEGHTYLTSAMHEQCRDLRDRWLAYVKSTKSVKRAYISIKGIYYQANVKGERVTWVCPYEFTNKAPKDVVHRILITFLELYLAHVGFVLFKLEHDQKKEQERQAQEEEETAAEVENFPASKEEQEKAEKLKKQTELFKGLSFYVSRENPKTHLNFLIESFSGTVVDQLVKGITHYVADRPQLPSGEEKLVGVDYVQPQWLFDCVNAKGLLPVDEYEMGKELPPHVSPFTVSISNDPDEIAELDKEVALDRRNNKDDVPTRVHEIRRMLNPSYNTTNPTEDVHLSDEDDDEADEQDGRELELEEENEEVSVSDDDSEELERVKENIERTKLSKKKLAKALEMGDNKPTEKENAQKKREKLRKKRLERAAESSEEKKQRLYKEAQEKEQAEKDMKKAVMNNKDRKLYTAMERGIKKRKRELETLESRREKVKKGKAKYDPKTNAVTYSS